MSATQPSRVPRVPPSVSYAEIARMLGIEYGRIACDRNVIARIGYTDGTSQVVDATVRIESNVIRIAVIGPTVDKDVGELSIEVRSNCPQVAGTLVEFLGSAQNPVFRAGDTISFEVALAFGPAQAAAQQV